MTNDLDPQPFNQVADVLRGLAAAVEALASLQLPQPKDRGLTVSEVASVMGLRSSSLVYKAIQDGTLKARRLHGKPLVLLSDLETYMRNLPVRRPTHPNRARAAEPGSLREILRQERQAGAKGGPEPRITAAR